MIDLKGLAFNTIILMLIALASVVILLFILNSIIPNFSGRALCKIYQVVLVFPLPKNIRPVIPECTLIPGTERLILPEENANEEFMAHYIKKCWEKSQDGKSGQTFACYELFLENVPTPFGEKETTEILSQKGLCKKIPNNIIEEDSSSFNCGTSNKIYWWPGHLQGSEITVIVKFNSTERMIEVI